MSAPTRKPVSGWIVAGLLFGWLAALAGLRPLMLPDEGRYGGVAWEMLRSGHWAVPTLDGMPYFHKPPLFYWIAAAAMRVLGPGEFAMRMPSLLGALLAAMSLYLFARRWAGLQHARWCAIVLVTQPFFFVAAQFANLDMLVAGCITAAVLLAAHAALLDAQGAPYRRPLLGAYAMAGLGLLAKGLIGVVLPVAALLCWLATAKRLSAVWRLVSWQGLLLLGLTGLPWFIDMQHRYAGFFDYFVIYHHFQRFSQGGFNNQEPFWFYPAVIAALTLPWSLLALRLFKRQDKALPDAPTAPPVPLQPLMWIWFAVVVLFFSIPRSKLVGYVLPALPPLAWSLATALQSPPLRRGIAKVLVACGAVVCAAIVIALAWYPLPSAKSIGATLRAQRHTGEPVVLLDRYPFDLPFYARLETDPMVVGHWTAQDTARDDWRKELADAGRFDPPAAAARLVAQQSLPAIVCRARVAWVIGTTDDVAAAGLAAEAVEAARSRAYSAWRVSASPRLCAER